MSNSFGFGGHNATIVLRRWDGEAVSEHVHRAGPEAGPTTRSWPPSIGWPRCCSSSGLDELEVEVGELRRAPGAPDGSPWPRPATAPRRRLPETTPASPYGEPAAGMRFVTAPLTGVWYAAPSPGARPYVTEGTRSPPAQVVGLIEAMKLFNEIKSDVGGIVTRILVESGTLVKRQQPVLEIDPR